MKKFVLITSILILCVVVSTCIFSINKLSTKEKREDAEYLVDFLVENYPYFDIKKESLKYDFLAHKDEITNKIIKTKNDKEFYCAIDETLNLLNNNHCYIINDKGQIEYLTSKNDLNYCGDINSKAVERADYWNNIRFKTTYIPDVIFKYVDGNYFVQFSKNKDINVGDILVKIEGMNVEKYLESNKEKYPLIYDKENKEIYTNSILFITHEINNKNKINVTCLSNNEEKNGTVNIEKGNEEKILNIYKKICKNQIDPIKTKIISKDNIAYMSVAHMSSEEKVMAQIDNFFREYKNYKNIIIDIRGNLGGSSEVSFNIIKNINKEESLIIDTYIGYNKSLFNDKYLEKNCIPELNKNDLPKKLNDIFKEDTMVENIKMPIFHSLDAFQGNIYLLIDNNVFSASETLASIVKKCKLGVVLGQTSTGD